MTQTIKQKREQQYRIQRAYELSPEGRAARKIRNELNREEGIFIYIQLLKEAEKELDSAYISGFSIETRKNKVEWLKERILDKITFPYEMFRGANG